MKKLIVILLFLSTITLSTNGQEEISEDVLAEVSKDIDYSQKKWTLVPRHEAEPIDPQAYEPKVSSPISSILGYIIAIVLIMAVILGVLYFMFSTSTEGNPSVESKSIEGETLDPDHIDNIDPISLIDEALANGDYRLALRLRFIDFIKRSSDLRLIKWRPEKTNQDYLYELKPHVDFAYLSSVILDYEKVWFGKYDISRQDYVLYAEQYDTLINQINTAHG